MRLFSRVLAFICLVGFAYGQAVLPAAERDALQEIGRRLGKRDWNFTVNPCSRSAPWLTQNTDESSTFENIVECNCTYDSGTTCHVTKISLKGQNLTGSLPLELIKLPFLKVIDLTRNYLSGSIPRQWGTMNLELISLVGNRVTGSLPKELANITTLTDLTLDFNQLSGAIPPEFGDFRQIRRLLLTSNNLSGELPERLSNLITLRDFRISDNNFNGSIPDFIRRWTNITRLEIQASGLTGPIPFGIASLPNLIDLRISDLNGNEQNFPPFSNMTNLEILILRNCNITGQLPIDIGNLRNLEVLDLSFNKLTGTIPPSISTLGSNANIYLTGNSLTGTLPTRMTNWAKSDLSYNNLTVESSAESCQRGSPNLFANSRGNTSGTFSCVRSCDQPNNYAFHINCGGKGGKVVGGYTYEEDTYPAGPATFYQSPTNWGFSSTGHFLNPDKNFSDTHIWPSNTPSSSPQNYQLSMDARLSPLSLTYFGFCLINGNYSVNLHFAEIIFTNDTSFHSLGRRIFDIYIQGELVWKDFDIEKEAGGVNREVIMPFTAVVSDNTLEIRFYWAGKGTTGIPYRGVYGPLISAISAINPDAVPNGISAGAIAGIVIAVVFTVVLVLVVLWWKGCLRRKHSMHHDLKGLDLRTGSFTLRQIKAATNNFDPANKIGEGGFGPVYKGVLLDGTIIAVKQLSSKSKQGNREFVNEIGMISALQHPHLVKLYGCCIEGDQLLLVYEYLENNSLARALFGPKEHQLDLDWRTRHKICVGIARGLAYLHEESRLKIVHRDIKATNVLLDGNLVPKISDFGLAKLHEEDDTHISTRIAGTFGYMAPEYAMRGYLTDKADVYSFGVVLLEVVCGRSNTSIRPKEESFYLLDWANSLKVKGDLMELVDPRLGSKYSKEEVMTAINVALLCTNPVAAERPSMSAVVSMLVGGAGVGSFVSELSVSVNKLNAEEIEMMGRDGPNKSVSMDVPWTASSGSTSDLYPIKLDTDYWEGRDRSVN